MGGGLGVSYDSDVEASPADLRSCLGLEFKGRKERLILEPGRSISNNDGVILTKIAYIKDEFVIVDAAMNDLLRPSLYQAKHEIWNIEKREGNSSVKNLSLIHI